MRDEFVWSDQVSAENEPRIMVHPENHLEKEGAFAAFILHRVGGIEKNPPSRCLRWLGGLLKFLQPLLVYGLDRQLQVEREAVAPTTHLTTDSPHPFCLPHGRNINPRGAASTSLGRL